MRYPKDEIVWVSYYCDNELQFIITSKPIRDFYFLYKVEEGKLKKLGRAKNPIELEDKFGVFEIYLS